MYCDLLNICYCLYMYVYVNTCVCICINCIYGVLSYVGGNKEYIYLYIYLSIYYLHLIKKYFTFIKSATVYFGVYVSTHIAKAICIYKAIPIAQFTSYHILN